MISGLKVVDWNTCKREWPDLRSIDFPEVSYHDVVDILIGIDTIHLHSAMEEFMENLVNQLLDAHHLVGSMLDLQKSAYPVNCPVMFNHFMCTLLLTWTML